MIRFFGTPSQEDIENLIYIALLEEHHSKNPEILFYYTPSCFKHNQFELYFIHPKTKEKGHITTEDDFADKHAIPSNRHPVAEKLMLRGVIPTWISTEEDYATWREQHFVPHLAVFSSEEIEQKRKTLTEENGMTRSNASSFSS